MAQSPARPTPYEVLGVNSTVSQEELRKAYRRMLRLSHPDTGGDAARFHAVQTAWLQIGDPANRAAYDRGSSQGPGGGHEPFQAGSSRQAPGHGHAEARDGDTATGWSTRQAYRGAGGARRAGSPLAKTYGYPGGRAREEFLALIEEWAGRGTPVKDPYDAAFVRSAPPEIRQRLAKAVAEELTAHQLASLGIGYTVWNAVAGWDEEYQIDHVVLGPAGLFAVHSDDWGGPVRLSRQEVTGQTLRRGETPLADLIHNARKVARKLGVRFTGYVVVVPDDDVENVVDTVQRGKRAGSCLASRSALPGIVRGAIGVAADRGQVAAADLMEVRTRLQQGLGLVLV